MKKIFRTCLFVGLFVGIFAITSKVNATGSFSVSPTSKSIEEGKTATITITAKDCGGQFEISSSDAEIASVSSSSEWIESGSKTITVKANKAGTATITVTATSVATTENPTKVTGSEPVQITVTEKSNTKKEDTTKSSNANLSTLGVTPKEYDFTGFKQDKTEYSVTVPNSVDSLKVAYKTADKNAKVKVTGNTGFEVGTNTIKVEVTAADGKTTKTYTIAVTKLATEDSKPGNLIDDKDSKNLYLSSLSIEGLELSPEFSKDVFAYEATIDMDENDLSKVNVNAQAENANATIEITGNTDLQEGENVINVIVKSNDSSEQTVYQITVNKISKSSEIANSKKHINKEHIIIGTFIAIVLIILIILIINHFRNKKYEEENDYTEEDDENKNYNDEYNNRYEELNQNDNFIEDLYKRRNNGETLNHTEKETIEDIENETDRIFNKPKQGETFEYEEKENTFEDDFKPRNKGKHF